MVNNDWPTLLRSQTVKVVCCLVVFPGTEFVRPVLNCCGFVLLVIVSIVSGENARTCNCFCCIAGIEGLATEMPGLRLDVLN